MLTTCSRATQQRITLFQWTDLIGLPVILVGETVYYVVEYHAHALESLSPEEIIHSQDPEGECAERSMPHPHMLSESNAPHVRFRCCRHQHDCH